MEPFSDEEAELVLYSDTTNIYEDEEEVLVDENDTTSCILVHDNEKMWSFFGDVVGTGFFSAMVILSLLIFGLPLLAFLLIVYLIYRSTRSGKQTDADESTKSSIRQIFIGVALLITEIWIGLGGILGCIAVLIICLAVGRLIGNRLAGHGHERTRKPSGFFSRKTEAKSDEQEDTIDGQR